jgi:hypothetical protein
MQIILWILGGIAAYRLWEDVTWLSVFVIILTLSYGVHGEENQEHAKKGEYSDSTGRRLMLSFVIVVIIFLYSLSV